MRIPRGIHDNPRSLAAEVRSQVANLQSDFDTGSASIAHRILDRGMCVIDAVAMYVDHVLSDLKTN